MTVGPRRLPNRPPSQLDFSRNKTSFARNPRFAPPAGDAALKWEASLQDYSNFLPPLSLPKPGDDASHKSDDAWYNSDLVTALALVGKGLMEIVGISLDGGIGDASRQLQLFREIHDFACHAPPSEPWVAVTRNDRDYVSFYENHDQASRDNSDPLLERDVHIWHVSDFRDGDCRPPPDADFMGYYRGLSAFDGQMFETNPETSFGDRRGVPQVEPDEDEVDDDDQ